MMKKRLLSYEPLPVIISAFLFILIIGCSSEKKAIEAKYFSGYMEINDGQEARLEWYFKNADKVRVQGIDREFSYEDFVMVKPTATTQYFITAYQGTNDSLRLTSKVNVKKQQTVTETTHSGPIPTKSFDFLPSPTSSEFASGMIGFDKTQNASRLKIIRTIYSDANPNRYIARAMLLDNNGNFLTDYSKEANLLKVKVLDSCENFSVQQSISSVKEISFNNTKNEPLDLGIILDNSSCSVIYNNVLNDIQDFASHLLPNDNLMFGIYNQNLYNLIPLKPSDQAINDFATLKLPAKKGMNALNKACFKALEEIRKGRSNRKALVIFTFNSDNASLIFMANDVARLSRESAIPIYIIGIGNAVNSYSLRYMTSITGGRFYHLLDDDYTKIKNILKEIYLGQRAYYEFTVNIAPELKCKALKPIYIVQAKDVKVQENYFLTLKPTTQYPQYQAIVSFSSKDSTVTADYIEPIKSLARVLQDNPSSKIELIGYCGSEGTDDFTKNLSSVRAEAVKRLLISNGAKAFQIKVRGEGCSKPLYYLEQAQWQADYNRRVEVKWLDPTVLPYELIANSVNNEEEAIKEVEQWEQRGQKAYYDRYMKATEPEYKIKVWGFSTSEDAQQAARDMNKKYKVNLVVE